MPTPIAQLKREAIMGTGFSWSDPTDCLTEAEEAAMEADHQDRLLHRWFDEMGAAFDALVEDIDAVAAEHSAALDKLQREPLPGLEPDVEAMVMKPAATALGSTTLLDAMNARKDAA